MKVKIGLETHVQLLTKSKAFCGCENPAKLAGEVKPNSLTCPTCLGLPGSKPRMNEVMIKFGIMVAESLGCRIAKEVHFSRKNYFYPDLSKNFQITQHEIPLGEAGEMVVEGNKIRITRVHMEEDPAKLVHVGGLGGEHVLVDYNRSGIPLLEIVTEPDFSSPKEARLYLQKLVLILEYLGVYSSDSKTIVKSDANISINGGERIEIKNITGTKEIEEALSFEIMRQSNLLKHGGKVVMATRAWNPDLGFTQQLRSKEQEEEYSYIAEPDLTVIDVSKSVKDKIKKSLPELPDQKYKRFLKEYKLPEKVVESLVSDINLADFFEDVAKKVDYKVAGSWISGYLKKTLNYHGIGFKESGVKSEWIVYLLELFKNGKITDKNAELAIRDMVQEKRHTKHIVKEYNYLVKRFDIDLILRELVKREKGAVADFYKGEEKALNYLIGLGMKETKGSVDAKDIRRVLIEMLK